MCDSLPLPSPIPSRSRVFLWLVQSRTHVLLSFHFLFLYFFSFFFFFFLSAPASISSSLKTSTILTDYYTLSFGLIHIYSSICSDEKSEYATIFKWLGRDTLLNVLFASFPPISCAPFLLQTQNHLTAFTQPAFELENKLRCVRRHKWAIIALIKI